MRERRGWSEGKPWSEKGVREDEARSLDLFGFSKNRHDL
ncbi:hypothetical protein CBM2623_B170261 [Cupriavidus taiwanensis]|nr:hypothetical protein CBM2608_B140332 [Cupriavidus taiwanensis]SPA33217.1 hypothetical protein CBM2623_B170261 [Cupriavidus taiwanensis]